MIFVLSLLLSFFFPMLLLARSLCAFFPSVFSLLFSMKLLLIKIYIYIYIYICYLSKKEKESGVIATHIIKQILSMICVQFDDYLG